jgi:hypothetical protein
MNTAHLHLLVNHLPILGAFLSLPVLAIALARRREPGILFAGVTLLALAAAGAGVALRSGEGAEEVVEDLPGVGEPTIEAHEEAADVASIFALAVALGGLATAGLAWRRGTTPLVPTAAVVAGAFATSAAMGWTGYLGGQIRHSEIRPDAPTYVLGAPGDDDDD